MGQKRNRAGNNSQNRNERNISNSREVSRRTKGKNRYSFEEDRRTTARYYDDDGYYQTEPKRRKKSASAKNRDDYTKKSKTEVPNTAAKAEKGKDVEEERMWSVRRSVSSWQSFNLFYQ